MYYFGIAHVYEIPTLLRLQSTILSFNHPKLDFEFYTTGSGPEKKLEKSWIFFKTPKRPWEHFLKTKMSQKSR